MSDAENVSLKAAGSGITFFTQPGSVTAWRMTLARESASHGSARAMLSRPSTSGMPPTRVAMTGLRAASASRTI